MVTDPGTPSSGVVLRRTGKDAAVGLESGLTGRLCCYAWITDVLLPFIVPHECKVMDTSEEQLCVFFLIRDVAFTVCQQCGEA